MQIPRPAIATATAALGLVIAVLPVGAATAAPSDPPAAEVAAPQGSFVAGVDQQTVSGRVLVTVRVNQSVAMLLRDPSGAVVGAKSARPSEPARFVLSGSGSTRATYTVSRQDGTAVTPVEVVFGAGTLAQPLDLTSYEQQVQMRREVLAGQRVQVLRYQMLPGGTLHFSIDGSTATVVAGADGIASIGVPFHEGINQITVAQQLGDQVSKERSYSYSFIR